MQNVKKKEAVTWGTFAYTIYNPIKKQQTYLWNLYIEKGEKFDHKNEENLKFKPKMIGNRVHRKRKIKRLFQIKKKKKT